MAVGREERRLAAIMAIDMVGYSRLIEADESGTLAAIRRLRQEVIDPLLNEHHGRVVKLMGDGALAEFTSVVDAVACAVAIQKNVRERQDSVPPEQRITFRIGVNLGDVVVEESDLLGDGVNVAARLEQLCDPGSILISGTAYDHLQGKLGLPLDFAGDQQVKNISRPVRTYRVRLDGVRGSWRLRLRQHQSKLRMAAGLVALLAVAGVSAWWFWPSEKTSGKAAIAVLPFDNFGEDDVMDRLANGITEEIIADLARFRNFDVIARNSTEVYRDRQIDIRQVGRDLNVDYVMEGSVQREGDRIRTTAQLIDAETGAHIWSDRWDRPAEDIFAVQGEISQTIASLLGGNVAGGLISRAQVQRAKRLRATDLQAYDYFLLGLERKNHPSKESVPIGIEYLTKSIALDPNFASAYSTRAWLHLFSIPFNGVDAKTGLASMAADAEKAVQMDSEDAEALSTLGYVRVNQGRYPEAEAHVRAALELSPADLHVLLTAALVLGFIGFPEEGAELADRAIRLDPHMTPDGLTATKDAYYMARRYEDTIAVVNRISEENRFRESWAFLAASHARLGHAEEAADARAKLLQAYPNVSAELMLNEEYNVFARKKDADHFVEGFRIADLPVCMKPEEIAKFESPKPLPECEAERAKMVAK